MNGSLRQKQVCDALRCSGLHAHYTDMFSKFLNGEKSLFTPCLKRLGNL
jgi:hypothetical protein